MQRLIIGCVLLVALGAAAVAAPMLEVDEVKYDFGSVLQGTVITHSFVLSNRGDAALEVSQPTASCGCTTTALPKSSLAPGESATLTARVDTSGFANRIQKTITFKTNDPNASSVALYVEGNVVLPAAYHITLGDLKYLFFLIIDVRSPAAYDAGHLLGAMNIPSAQLPLWTEILPRDIILVLYDDSGTESATQAKSLQELGFSQARSLAGGLAAWSVVPGATSYVSGTLPSLPAPTPATLEPHEMGTGDLRSIYLLVIDVRTPEQFAARSGHFMGAVNIPAADLALWQAKLPTDVIIVLYDQTGEESDRQAQVLQAAGLGRVRSLAGGYDAWVRSYGITFLIAERP